MLTRHIFLATALTTAMCVVTRVASSEPHRRVRFPATKSSIHGGKGIARIAFYVCADDIDSGIALPRPELAVRACKRGAKRAAPVYGPYRYPISNSKNDWYSARDYPYERLDGRQYSRGGYLPSP